MEPEHYYTLSVFTENKIGLLTRVAIVLTRRRMNIESMCVSESEVRGIHRYTIVIKTTISQAVKVVAQVSKLVDVLLAFVHKEEEVVHREMALYKLKSGPENTSALVKIIREGEARVLNLEKEFMVIEKTGHRDELERMYKALEPFGMLEFSSSGRVVITRAMKELPTHLAELSATEKL